MIKEKTISVRAYKSSLQMILNTLRIYGRDEAINMVGREIEKMELWLSNPDHEGRLMRYRDDDEQEA